MASIKVFKNKETGNFSLFDVWAKKNTIELQFNSAEELYNSVQGCKARIKRASGQSWGDNNKYTLKMAQNDFERYAK